jgi:release factor glutamine methyltransferase
MPETWTPLKLIAWTQEWFGKKGVDAPRLTAELLLARALRCDRVRLYLDFDKPIGEAELAAFRELVRRRGEGEPTAYLLGEREFFGRAFRVDARVLIPRPETELLVEAGLAALPEGGRALDLCTGSGAIAISLALGRAGARVLATDVSADALDVAAENARRLGAEGVVELARGDLWAAVPDHAGPFDVIAANPPYVPSREVPALAREVRREPCIALDGGADGLDLVRRIVAGAPARLAPGGLLLVELHESHGPAFLALCEGAGLVRAEVRRDLAGLPRLGVAHMAGARTST